MKRILSIWPTVGTISRLLPCCSSLIHMFFLIRWGCWVLTGFWPLPCGRPFSSRRCDRGSETAFSDARFLVGLLASSSRGRGIGSRRLSHLRSQQSCLIFPGTSHALILGQAFREGPHFPSYHRSCSCLSDVGLIWPWPTI